MVRPLSPRAFSPPLGARLSGLHLESNTTVRGTRPLSPRLKRKWRQEREELERTLSSVHFAIKKANKTLGLVAESCTGAERIQKSCTTLACQSFDAEHASVSKKLDIEAAVASNAAGELRFQLEKLDHAVNQLEESSAELREHLLSHTRVLELLDEKPLTVPEVRAVSKSHASLV